MNLRQISFEETKRFSSIFLDYINGKQELQQFYGYTPDIENFGKAITERTLTSQKRTLLVDALKNQYDKLGSNKEVLKNIESLLQPNTYTITTGHQLNIFTGPLFFIYKVAAVIKMSALLKDRFPEYNFVPVYWMASEDHDFEEINNFRLFGKKYTWQTDQQGPVGRFATDSMKSLLDEIPEKPAFCVDGYLGQQNLSDATRYIVNELFGEHGLVILDADHRGLKREFISVMRDDLLEQNASRLAGDTTNRLEKLGYKSQVFPREINLFYLGDGQRQRITMEGGKYSLLNSSKSFSKEQITQLLEEHPEDFSPNVVLRPLYQEAILPNLAYVGGPAEIAYWLQLQDVFSHFDLPFPILFPRLFVMNIARAISRKVAKLELSTPDLFKSFDELKELLLFSDGTPEHDLTEELQEIEKVFEAVKQKAGNVDKSLEGFVMSEYKKTEKGIVNIQKRLKRSEEQKEEVKLNQLKDVLEKLFPGGQPQEREDNFLNFYINNPNFIEELIEVLDPFSLKYNILAEDV